MNVRSANGLATNVKVFVVYWGFRERRLQRSFCDECEGKISGNVADTENICDVCFLVHQ